MRTVSGDWAVAAGGARGGAARLECRCGGAVGGHGARVAAGVTAAVQGLDVVRREARMVQYTCTAGGDFLCRCDADFPSDEDAGQEAVAVHV